MKRALTQIEKVLIAFYRVAQGSKARVPYEELVLQAWRDFPEDFSLRNHPEHPDASDVHKKLYQSLKPNGFVVSLGDKVFRLTDEGIEHAERLERALDGTPAVASQHEKARLSRGQQQFIDHALKSRAFAAWKNGMRDELVDYDARLFFQFSTATGTDQRRARAQAATIAIDRACEIGLPESASLRGLSEFLMTKFAVLFREG